MKRIHMILLAAMAMSAIGGIGASSASAAKVHGPLWLVRNALTYDCVREIGANTGFKTLLECLGGLNNPSNGEWLLLELGNVSGALQLDEGALILDLNLGNFTLFVNKLGVVVEISCKHTDSEGAIEGGDPGKNHELITFLECSLPRNSSCVVNSPGESSGTIMVNAKTELVLRASEPRSHNLSVLFEPLEGSVFVRLVLSGGGCPIFSEGEQEVKGDILGELEPEEGTVTEGMLTFPKEPIKKAFRWEPSTQELKEITIGLEVFGEKAKQLGLADVWLEHGGLLGAHCGGCN